MSYDDKPYYHTEFVGCYTNDPHFIDAANGDYRLAADSPCVDTGDNALIVGMRDLDGNARVVNGTVDIGCYERLLDAMTYYVNVNTGDDTNAGVSRDFPKKTIQSAVDMAREGATISVAPGTYDPFATANKKLFIVGEQGASKTFIDGHGNYVRGNQVILTEYRAGDDATNTTVRGFTIQHLVNVDGGIIQNCIVRENNTWSLGGGAVNMAIAENCLIINNRGMNGAAGDKTLFRNCTLVGNTARDLDGVCLSSVLENCIVYGNGNNGRQTWDYYFNRSWLSKLDHREVNVLENDPLFVNAAGGDYRLAADSPCIDAGENSYVVGERDLDGSERIVNGRVDIGCYEYGSVGGPYIENVGGERWTYVIKNGEAWVGDGTHAAVTNTIVGAVDVPSELRGCPVTAIDHSAFLDCGEMTSVTIPASVTKIGSEAFCGCEKLADVWFEGDTIGKIGRHAFLGCYWDLIMHVPAEWQGRGRTITGYTVWRGGSSDVEKCVNMTVTNVVVQYVLNSIRPEIAVPVSNSVGLVNIITEVASSGAVSVPTEWKDVYPQFETKYGADFGKALAMKTGKKDGAGNDMFVWQDFVAGTDPTDENDQFTASITIVDGVPVISYTPELTAEQAALRVYKTYGKMKLTDAAWTDITSKTSEERTNYNFFKVTVEMK